MVEKCLTWPGFHGKLLLRDSKSVEAQGERVVTRKEAKVEIGNMAGDTGHVLWHSRHREG